MNEFFTKTKKSNSFSGIRKHSFSNDSVKGAIAPQSHLPSAFKFLLVSILFLILIGSVHAGLTDNLVSYYNIKGDSL